MRNGQNNNKRMRGRNRKGTNPLTRVYESNGPDVKIRGTAHHVAEKYLQLARDAQGSGDPVAAENYYQHAEHYFRLIAAAQEQMRQHQPFGRPDMDMRDDQMDDLDDDNTSAFGMEPGYGSQPPYAPQQQREGRDNREMRDNRDNRDHRDNRENREPRENRERFDRDGQSRAPAQNFSQNTQNNSTNEGGDVDRLPSFITGGAAPQAQAGTGENGSHERPRQEGRQEGRDGPSRFPLHRRRRRHHTPREGGAAVAEDAPANQGE